jgi:hypothetical protein
MSWAAGTGLTANDATVSVGQVEYGHNTSPTAVTVSALANGHTHGRHNLNVLFKTFNDDNPITMNTQTYTLRVSSPYCETTGSYSWPAVSPGEERGYMLTSNTAASNWVIAAAGFTSN